MAAITVEELKKLSETAEREQREEQDNASTFLEIIGRSRRETYVSSLLAYVIRKDDTLLAKLLQYALKDSAPEIAKDMPEIAVKYVDCEANMSGGRADIFVTGKFKGGDNFTLTIENKVDSWEHGGQTNVYYNYVTTRYAGAANAFIYLTPYDNSVCECEQFEVLTYKELGGMITYVNDSKICDFKQHIERNFSEKETMKETTLQILENYGEYKKLFSDAEKEVTKLRKAIKDELSARYQDGYQVGNKDKSIWVNRTEWKDKTKGYWFYVELYFEAFDLNAISVKATVGVYHKNKDIIQFCDNNNPELWDNGGKMSIKEYYTFKKIPFPFICTEEDRIFGDRWTEELKSFTYSNIAEMIEMLDNVFEDFKIFLSKE